jgi:hypothetical protein
MANQLEQDLRRAVENFVTDVESAAQRAVLRILRSAFDGTSCHTGDTAGSASDDTPPSSSPTRRRALIADELVSMRARLASLIREQPGQSTAQLARTIGTTSNRLRPLLRQLVDAGTIRIEERFLRGLWRYTYFATVPVHGSRDDVPIAAAETTA